MRRHDMPRLLIAAIVLLALSSAALGQSAIAARYEGRWEVQANGDVQLTRQFMLPMQMYRAWKEADVHMLDARGFSSGRSNVEVTDRTAQWDDFNRTLTLKMTVLGLAQNKDTCWEVKIQPGEVYSNLDEAKKTAYFHFAADSPLGRVEGQDVITFPAAASALTWNDATRIITYHLPTPTQVGPSSAVWWVLFGVCAFLSAGCFGASRQESPFQAAQKAIARFRRR